MLIHTITIDKRKLSYDIRSIVQHGVNSDAIQLSPDYEWAEFERISIVMSKDGQSTAIPWTGDPVPIPYELMEEPGLLYLTAIGRTGDDIRVVTERMQLPLAVVDAGDISGSYEPGDPALDEVEQAIKDANDAADSANDAATKANQAAEYASKLPTISISEGKPNWGQNKGDICIDAENGDLWEFQEE